MRGIKVGNRVLPYWAFWLFLFIIIFPFKDGSYKNNIALEKNVIDDVSLDTTKKDITKNNKFFVIKVIDGDTIKLDNGEMVRYIGVNTPETVRSDYPIECFGREASKKNKELVLGREVTLKKDISDRDKYGRLLRYVYVGDVFINLKLVKDGYAYAVTISPNVKYSNLFLDAQKNAKENNLGLWGSCKEKENFYIKKNISEKDNKLCNIKGNINKKGEKIYHIKSCDYYYETKINKSNGERWFCSEDEALDAGWRKALNCNN